MPVSEFLAQIQLIAYDCDGVMTDNRVIVDEFGHESAIFNRGDGYGISRIRELGISQIVISTEENPIVARRCAKLKLDVEHGVRDKERNLRRYCEENDIPLGNVLFIGNDLNDMGALMAAGHRGCPQDAESEVKAVCDWISTKKGGDGVIRELYRDICEARGV